MRKRWIAGIALSVVLVFALAVGALAADTTDAAFQRIRVVFDVTQAFHKDGANLDKFTQGAIKGGLEALGDPYTAYFTPDEFTSFMDSLNGKFSGIGAYLEQVGNYVVVSAPIKGSPAAKAGIMSGDRILEANGVSLVGSTTSNASKLIRGEPGTDVTLKIERPSEHRTFTLTVTRGVVVVPEVDYKMIGTDIGYIQLSSFGDTAAKDFYVAVDALKAKGAKGLVLDVRQNGGGYLDAAVAIASAFVPKGEPVVWQVGKKGKSSLVSEGRLINLPTTMLVDQGSASASEILAGAIQDYGAAPLIGTKTFGKGTVQQILPLVMGGAMKVTIAEYLTPKERHVHGVSLMPDYVVENEKGSSERSAPMPFTRVLLPSSVGLDVQALQYRLQTIGYDVTPTGFLDNRTVDAVVAFNQKHGLGSEAVVTESTLVELNALIQAHYRVVEPKDLQLEKALELLRAKLK